jgi:hypothetical protein
LEDDVEHVPGLFGRGDASAGQVVRQDDPEQQVADDGRDTFGWEVAEPAGINQGFEECRLFFGGFARAFRFEIERPVPVAEIGPFLDEQFGHFRPVVEKGQVRQNRRFEPDERVDRHVVHDAVDCGGKVLHGTIHRGQEQVVLGRKITVDGPLADAEVVGDGLDVGVTEPEPGECLRGGGQDFRLPAGSEPGVLRPARSLQFERHKNTTVGERII